MHGSGNVQTKTIFEVSGNVTETENMFLDINYFDMNSFICFSIGVTALNLGQTCIFYSQNTGITRMDALAEFNNYMERLSDACSCHDV